MGHLCQTPALQPIGFARKMRRNGARRRDAHRSARPPEDAMRFSKMRFSKTRFAKFALLGLCAAVVGAGAAHAQEPVKIRVSWVAPVANWASILLEKKDLARHAGKSYVMEPVRYAGTPLIITALANRELEIGNLAYSTLALAVQNAGLDDLRIVADEFQDGVEGYYSQEYMALKAGPLRNVGALKGKMT